MKFCSELMTSELHLQKWHGALNDFYFIERKNLESCTNRELSDEAVSVFASSLCQRNEGLGADGIVIWENDSQSGVIAAGIWNSDGSRAQTCGNALRCFSALLFSQNLWDGFTPLQIRALTLNDKHSQTDRATFATLLQASQTHVSTLFKATVAMGRVVELREGLLGEFLSLLRGTEQSIWNKIVGSVTFVQLANPHLVLRLNSACFAQITTDDFSRFGLFLQSEDVCKKLNIPVSNIGFVEQAENSNDLPLNAIVFERGAGLTQCCGSGGCAMKVALDSESAPKLGLKPRALKMPGGIIEISQRNGELILEGPAQKVATVKIPPVG